MGRNFIASHLEGDVADAQNVALVDSTGDNAMDDANNSARVTIVSGAAAGTEFNEDAAASGGEAGPAILGVRQDADTSPVSLDGDFHQFIFDNAGALKTHVKTSALPSGAATSANQLADGHNVTVDSASNTTASGALGALNDAVTISGQGSGTILWEVDTGTLSGTVIFEATLDDSNWFAIDAVLDPGSVSDAAIFQTITSFGVRGFIKTSGYSQVRMRVSAFTSGTSNARLEASLGSGHLITVMGNIDHNDPDSGAPLKTGGRASSALPDAVATNDRVGFYVDARGIQHIKIEDGSDNDRSLDISAQNAALTTGDVAHDTADAGNSIKQGAKAIAHGSNPTAVAANDRTDLYANRAGIPWVIGGHPNVITREVTVTDSDGAQTGISLASVSAGNKIIVTSVQAITGDKNSKPIEVRVAFSTTTTLPTASTTGVDGVLLSSSSLGKGKEISRGDGSGIIGIGADDEDLRYTCEDPVNGDVRIVASFYTVES